MNFNSVFGLEWRARLPLVLGGSDGEDSFSMNVTNWAGFGGSFLIGVCTLSLGVKFTI